MEIHVYIHIYIYVDVCIYIYIYIYRCATYVYTICICICTSLYIHILCIHTCVHMSHAGSLDAGLETWRGPAAVTRMRKVRRPGHKDVNKAFPRDFLWAPTRVLGSHRAIQGPS